MRLVNRFVCLAACALLAVGVCAPGEFPRQGAAGQATPAPVESYTCSDPCTEGLPVFGPETFQRLPGAPVTETRLFDVPWDSAGCLSLVNHGCESARIELDGNSLVTPVELKSGVPEIRVQVLLPQGSYELSVRLASAAGCSADVQIRACIPQPCSEVAAAWCEAQGFSVALYTEGAVICTAEGYDEYAHCEDCSIYNIVVYENFAGDPLCVGDLCTTLAGNVYGGHDPCECGDNLRYCGPWDMQGCLPY